LALLVLAACSEASAPTSDPGDDEALVTRVVDGDTVEVEFGGRELDVRLIGIDTPETVKPGEPVECFGPEASAYTQARLEGEAVRLGFDVERIDPFDRTLAYVWIGDELFNETLVREGYALVATFPPNVMHVERFRDALRLAREEGLGLWSACP
jgi:micrococcal nuclease